MTDGMARAEPLTPERRREMTRRALLDAAAVEFGAKGFHGTSLDAVAAAAGFTKGAVYSNFESKADLFLAVLDDRLEHDRQLAIEQIVDDTSPPEEHMTRMREAVAEMGAHEGWITLLLEFVLYAVRNPEAREQLAAFRARQQAMTEGLIATEHEQRGTRPRYPVPLLALISLCLYDGVELQRLIDPDSIDQSTGDALLQFLHENNGLPWPEGADPDA
jgi:AcrR family transcriptional regulator